MKWFLRRSKWFDYTRRRHCGCIAGRGFNSRRLHSDQFARHRKLALFFGLRKISRNLRIYGVKSGPDRGPGRRIPGSNQTRVDSFGGRHQPGQQKITRLHNRRESGRNGDAKGERFSLQGRRWRFPRGLDPEIVETRKSRIRQPVSWRFSVG